MWYYEEKRSRDSWRRDTDTIGEIYMCRDDFYRHGEMEICSGKMLDNYDIIICELWCQLQRHRIMTEKGW